MINRRTLLLGSLASVGAIAGLSACAPSTPEPGSGKITVGLTYIPNVQFSAFYLGVSAGIFERHGLDVTLRHHGQQEDVFGAVLGGQEDIVFASADEATVAAARGQELRTFAVSYQTYPIQVLGRADLTIDPAGGLEVLKGHTLGIPGHFGSSYYAALAAIHKAGLSEADVELVDIGYTGISALTGEKVDFIMGFSNNELVQLESQGLGGTVIPVFDADAPTLVGPSLVTVGTRNSDDVLRALAAGMKEAEEAILADPQAALDATAEQVPAMADPVQRESAAKVLEATSQLWLRNGKVDVSVDPAAFERMGTFLAEAGIIEAPPEKFYLQLG